MARARITSIDAVDQLTAAMRRFLEEATSALEELDLEVQKALEWIFHERKDYWNEQLRRGSDRVSESKVLLQQSQTFRRIGDYRPSCREEKKALETAVRRLRLAEHKVERVRHWARVVDHAVNEYKGGVHHLARFLEADMPQALATLGRISSALETYVTLQSQAEALSPEQFATLRQPDTAAAPTAASGTGTPVENPQAVTADRADESSAQAAAADVLPPETREAGASELHDEGRDHHAGTREPQP